MTRWPLSAFVSLNGAVRSCRYRNRPGRISRRFPGVFLCGCAVGALVSCSRDAPVMARGGGDVSVFSLERGSAPPGGNACVSYPRGAGGPSPRPTCSSGATRAARAAGGVSLLPLPAVCTDAPHYQPVTAPGCPVIETRRRCHPHGSTHPRLHDHRGRTGRALDRSQTTNETDTGRVQRHVGEPPTRVRLQAVRTTLARPVPPRRRDHPTGELVEPVRLLPGQARLLVRRDELVRDPAAEPVPGGVARPARVDVAGAGRVAREISGESVRESGGCGGVQMVERILLVVCGLQIQATDCAAAAAHGPNMWTRKANAGRGAPFAWVSTATNFAIETQRRTDACRAGRIFCASTESPSTPTMRCSPLRVVAARFAGRNTIESCGGMGGNTSPLGTESFPSITTTTLARSGAFSAHPAIGSSAPPGTIRSGCAQPLPTSSARSSSRRVPVPGGLKHPSVDSRLPGGRNSERERP